MNCSVAQSNFISFIAGGLDGEDLEAFLDHLDQCPQCREELEINYSMYRGLEILDRDSDEPLNVQKEMEDMISQAKKTVARRRRIKRAAAFFVVLFVSAMVLFWTIERKV